MAEHDSQTDPPDELITVFQAAQILAARRDTVWSLIRRGELALVRQSSLARTSGKLYAGGREKLLVRRSEVEELASGISWQRARQHP
jgi:hypothetical protein